MNIEEVLKQFSKKEDFVGDIDKTTVEEAKAAIQDLTNAAQRFSELMTGVQSTDPLTYKVLAMIPDHVMFLHSDGVYLASADHKLMFGPCMIDAGILVTPTTDQYLAARRIKPIATKICTFESLSLDSWFIPLPIMDTIDDVDMFELSDVQFKATAQKTFYWRAAPTSVSAMDHAQDRKVVKLIFDE